MDELKYGTRDKRGDYRPNAPLQVGALLDIPWSLWRVIKWLPGFLLPWNVLFMLLGAGLWFFATPAKETLATLNWDWVLVLLARNVVIVLVIFGALEFVLYAKRKQGHRFKYNSKFPTDTPSDVFMFNSQNIDNIIRTFGTGLPIWTAYEVFLLHAWATGFGPWALFGDSPIWLVVFWLVIPLIHDFHFFCIHWLIHQGPLYRWIHKVHHNSVNPSPWSSLSMHPVEQLLYWSDSLIHLILPSHPMLVLYHLQTTGTGAVIGHVGFDRVETDKDTSYQTHAFAHYLHHKYFDVNFADGSLPLDKWFGTWHDGTKEGDRLMRARFKRKKERANRS